MSYSAIKLLLCVLCVAYATEDTDGERRFLDSNSRLLKLHSSDGVVPRRALDECVYSDLECQTKCDTSFGASFAVQVDFSIETETCTCTTEITIQEYIDEIGSVEEITGTVEIDMQILMDATGSMSASIEAMSNALIEMLDNIVADVKADTGFDAILRVGVVGYRDPFANAESEFISFTTDNAAVKQFLENLAALGGGDLPEDVNGGLKIMLDQEWTSEHKFIVHVSDATALGIPAPDADGVDYADLFSEINEKHITYIFGKLKSATNPMIAAYNEVYAVNEAGVLVEDASDAEIDILNLEGLSASEMTVAFTTELVTKIVTRVEEKIVTQQLGQWTVCETAQPTFAPSNSPTAEPTAQPTFAPSNSPTAEPTSEPTSSKFACVPSVSTCYEVSGILGAGCYSDPADLGINAGYALNSGGSTAAMWSQGFNYTPESLCKQACDASPLCGGFYFAGQNGVTCKFQSIEQATSEECLNKPSMMNCADIPASGSQCWWGGEWPNNCVDLYSDISNQEHMHWICSGDEPEPQPVEEELPFCVCHENYDWTSFGEVCETHCMTTSGEAYCHPGNGISTEPCGRQECWPENQVRCRMPESETELNLDFDYVALGNGNDGFCRDYSGSMKFLNDIDLPSETHCKDLCSQLFACAGYQYGRVGKPQDCNLYSAAKTVSTHTNTFASCQQKQGQIVHDGYVWRGSGFCRDIDGVTNNFLESTNYSTELECRQWCDAEANCEGFAYGTGTNQQKCNLYSKAKTSTGKSEGLGGCWAKPSED